MDSLCFPEENHTKYHANRTIINEISLRLWKWIFNFLHYGPNYVVLVPIASAEHNESKGVRFRKDLKRNAETLDIPQILMVFKPLQGSKARVYKGAVLAPSCEQPTCPVVKVIIGEENCASVRAFGMTWSQSYILMLRAYEHARTLLQFSSPILTLATG